MRNDLLEFIEESKKTFEEKWQRNCNLLNIRDSLGSIAECIKQNKLTDDEIKAFKTTVNVIIRNISF